MQKVELTEYVARRGWKVKIYRDAGQSGAKESRPGLDYLLSDVRQRRVDVIVVSALDRLARSHRGRLHPGFDGLITRPVAGYHYSANWVICIGRTLTC